MKTHTLQYNLPHEPFVAFDIIDENNIRTPYKEFRHIIDGVFTPAGLVHIGEAVPTDVAMQLLGKGYHGVIGDMPEGVVYKYESKDGFVCSGKFVSHPDVGNDEIFRSHIDQNIYNNMKSKYRNTYINPITGLAIEGIQ